MGTEKEYIEKDLWVIRNFLSEEELEWFNKQANDPEGWYPTMRSPYGGNIRNKFLGYVPEYGEDGILIPHTQRIIQSLCQYHILRILRIG